MVHKDIGIILVETKVETDSKAYSQLDTAQTEVLKLDGKIINEACMCDYCKLEVLLDESCFTKVIALPCTHVKDIKCVHNKSVYFQLGKNHLKDYGSFDKWWLEMKKNSHGGASINHKIIPKILIKLSKNQSSHSLEVLKWLQRQKFKVNTWKESKIQTVLFYKKSGNTSL